MRKIIENRSLLEVAGFFCVFGMLLEAAGFFVVLVPEMRRTKKKSRFAGKWGKRSLLEAAGF